jgi:hypothetical protein
MTKMRRMAETGPTENRPQLLLIDDDRKLRRLLTRYLSIGSVSIAEV